jgi:drug/metabolite transporter (DMT)-like permease
MLLATFYFSLMNIFIKAVTHLPAMEIVFFRCGISLLICLYYLKKEGVNWRGSNRKMLLLRGVFGTIALYLYFVTIANMPLGTAVIIQYLSPVFTSILAIFVLSERITGRQWFFYGVSFAGILVIKGFDENIQMMYLLIGILSAIGSAAAYVTIRSMKQAENPLVVVFHFQLIGTLTGGVFSAFNFTMPVGADWFHLLMVGIFTQLGQLYMTKSLQLEPVARVSILIYTGVIYATAAGFFIFGETYKFSTLAGMALVVAGVALSIFYRRK